MKKSVCGFAFCAGLVLLLTACVSTGKPEEVPVLPVKTEQEAIPENRASSDEVQFPAIYYNENAFGQYALAEAKADVIYADVVTSDKILMLAAGTIEDQKKADEEFAEIARSVYKVPEEFSYNCIIMKYPLEYYYKGAKSVSEIEVLYFNMTILLDFEDASPAHPVTVNQNDQIGYINRNSGAVLRCKDLCEALVSCCRTVPKYYDGYWYFGVEIYSSSIAKYLLFQPVSSADDEIYFPSDGMTNTLEVMTHCSKEGYDYVSLYGGEMVRFKTQLSEYPSLVNETKSVTEKNVRDEMLDARNLDVKVDMDGLTWHFFFPDYFLDYFKDEYELGTDIYLYGNIIYAYDNELYLYGRDFQMYDPDDEVDYKLDVIMQANFGDNYLR